MTNKNFYRWNRNDNLSGGGLVLAENIEDAREKLAKKYSVNSDNFGIWPWENDDYYDKDNVDIFDIY